VELNVYTCTGTVLEFLWRTIVPWQASVRPAGLEGQLCQRIDSTHEPALGMEVRRVTVRSAPNRPLRRPTGPYEWHDVSRGSCWKETHSVVDE
jgi:hypothetical protein